ncbi:uncharacterized protein LOC136041608 [Artemia franciscana]|uniref:THAP-type domain-containing protein n=1 Tax=Artemia franciscana TaxID=6661 RepID=A0AA88H5H7_ARTSF|nr:hypothetical protein QYM36_017878 [Artemia franciscana]
MNNKSVKCIVCSFFEFKDTDVQLFNFPSDKKKMELWRKAINANYSFMSPSKRSYICAFHFELSMFSENGELLDTAVPNVWLDYSKPEDDQQTVKRKKPGNDTSPSDSGSILDQLDSPPENEGKRKYSVLKKYPRRKSKVIFLPKDNCEVDNKLTSDDSEPEETAAKRVKPGSLKNARDKTIPRPFEIYVSEPTSKTRYTAECITCEKYMFDSTQIVMHIKDEHIQAQGSFQCRICMEKFGFLFACQNHLAMHLESHFP